MNAQSETDIERRAPEFPPDTRLRLAAKLLASVEGPTKSILDDEEALDLAERRANELNSGSVKGFDYREEMLRIRSSLSR